MIEDEKRIWKVAILYLIVFKKLKTKIRDKIENKRSQRKTRVKKENKNMRRSEVREEIGQTGNRMAGKSDLSYY